MGIAVHMYKGVILSICLVLGGTSFAWSDDRPGAGSVCKAPLLYSPMHYGFDQALVMQAFRDWFELAMDPLRSTTGIHSISAFRAMNENLGFELDVEARKRSIPEENRLTYGLRVSEPAGLAALSTRARNNLLHRSPPEIDRRGLLITNLIAGSCIPEERNDNERIAANLVAAEASDDVHVHLLEWSMRLRDAGCVGPGAYERISAQLAHRTQAVFDSSERREQILAAFVLLRAGYGDLLEPAHMTRVLDYMTDRAVAEDNTAKPEREDVLLAGAYVLGQVLVYGSAGAPQDAMMQVVQEMRTQGITGDRDTLLRAVRLPETRLAGQDAESCNMCQTNGRSDL